MTKNILHPHQFGSCVNHSTNLVIVIIIIIYFYFLVYLK